LAIVALGYSEPTLGEAGVEKVLPVSFKL